MKARPAVLAFLVCVGGLSIGVSAVQQGRGTDAKTITLQKIKDNLYLATGGGGNSAVFVTDLGVVIVDTKLPEWGQPLLAKIKTITDKPIATIINTHAHGDSCSARRTRGSY